MRPVVVVPTLRGTSRQGGVWVGLAVLVAALSASLLLLMMVASPARADTTFTVNSNDANNDGECTTAPNGCTLRDAIQAANLTDGNDTIVFDLGHLGQTPTITLGFPLYINDLSGGLTIDGQSAPVTISGGKTARVFEVYDGSKLTLNNLTVADGQSVTGSGGGLAHWGGTVTVTNSTFSGNTALQGGGIYSQGPLTVTNSTFSGNSASQSGGGILNNYGTAALNNTIVANSTSGDNCVGTITNGGYNLDSGATCGFGTSNNSLSGFDPMLGTLAYNGGPTKTIALQEGSPAIDKGETTLTTDQRGCSRPQGVADDIGAFELGVNCAPTAKDDPTTAGDPKYSVDEDGSLTVLAIDGVLANDTDPDKEDPLTATMVSGPTNGTLTLNSDGSFTYKPNAGYSGTDSFTYKANDGSLDSNVATVSITVNPKPAPTVTSVTPSETTGVSRTPNITATFSQEMNPTTINNTTVTLSVPGRKGVPQLVRATVICNDPCTTATLTPSKRLAGDKEYTATVKGGASGVKDTADPGNTLDDGDTSDGNDDYTWKFRTVRK